MKSNRFSLAPVLAPAGAVSEAHPATPERAYGAGRVAPAPSAVGWGWLPELSVVCALGLLVVALADTAARNQIGWAEGLFWAGLVVMFVPVALRLSTARATRRETLGLVVVLGLALYLVKLLHSPVAFTNIDEFLHWRTLDDIVQSGHLFRENPLLPASALYPGLEIVVAALVGLTGLTYFSAGVVVLGAARLVLMLGLFLFYERVGGSWRVAGIASLVYAANPNFLFFDADFSYESLALPLAILVVFLLVRREEAPADSRVGLTVTALLALGAVIGTHHVTSYALVAFLGLWTLAARYAERGQEKSEQWGPGELSLLALVGTLTWLVLVANLTIGYLAPHLTGAVSELIQLLAREQTGRQVFVSSTGQVAPIWERLTGITASGLILLGLPFGLLQVWRRHRRQAIALALGVSALAYPVSLAFRFTDSGWEAANRSSEFLFVALGFVLARGVVWLADRAPRPVRRDHAPVLAVGAVILFLGGVIAGWPPAWRLPGAYLVDNGTRSIEPQGVMAAVWARAYLGPGNRLGADSTNMLLMGSYGGQHISTSLSGGVDVPWLLFAPQIDADLEALLRQSHLRYLLVDHRLARKPQLVRSYYPAVAPDRVLAKFDQIKNVSRVFDSGDIVIYDIGAISGS